MPFRVSVQEHQIEFDGDPAFEVVARIGSDEVGRLIYVDAYLGGNVRPLSKGLGVLDTYQGCGIGRQIIDFVVRKHLGERLRVQRSRIIPQSSGFWTKMVAQGYVEII